MYACVCLCILVITFFIFIHFSRVFLVPYYVLNAVKKTVYMVRLQNILVFPSPILLSFRNIPLTDKSLTSQVQTLADPLSPPKNLKAQRTSHDNKTMVITWEPACQQLLEYKLQYLVSVLSPFWDYLYAFPGIDSAE